MGYISRYPVGGAHRPLGGRRAASQHERREPAVDDSLQDQSPLAILVNSDDPFNAKTAVGVLRYGRSPIVAMVDPERAGRTAADVYGIRPDVPIVAGVRDVPARAKRLLVGIASRGGQLPEEMRAEIMTA